MLKHFRNYASAGLIGSLIGLVTFPLLTRNLSVDAYGWLGLVSVTVTVFIGIGKLGMQTAMLRFFGEARAQGKRQLADLMGTMAGATLLLASASLALWLLYTVFVVPVLPDGRTAVPLFYVAAALVPIKVVFSIASSVLKADQRSGVLGTVTIIEKALKLSFIVLIVTALGVSSEKVMASTVVVELITLVLVLYIGRQYLRDAQPHLSRSRMKPLIAFGLPAMTAELITVLLETGDRYVVQAYLGSVELGHYSAAVNICLYLEFVLILSLQSAIVPHYVQLFEERGREATLAFLNTTLRYYFAIALGIFAVFSATAPVLLILLAGERYEPGVVVIIWF
ncbi:MAG: oligosaccharide flippase family protein, partial [Pseudomonadota bacterium]